MPVAKQPSSTDAPLTLDMPEGYNLAMKPSGVPVMKRTAIFLRPDQVEELRVLSDLTGAPWAELIRRSIDLYLQSRKEELDAAKKSQGKKR